MKARNRDRGAITLSVIAPILAAIIGGAAAIGAAIQIVSLAPSNASDQPAASQVSNSDIQYGNR